MLIGGSGYTWLAAAAMGLLLAFWLARIGWKEPVVRNLVFLLITLAVYSIANGVALSGGDLPVPWWVLAMATIITPAAVLGFYGAYRFSNRDKSWLNSWLLKFWPAAGSLAVLTFIFPSLWFRFEDARTIVAGPMFLFVGINYVLLAALALELTRDAVKEEQDTAKRRSMLGLALGFAFLPAYVATSELFFVDIFDLGAEASEDAVRFIGIFKDLAHYLSILAGVILAGMFVILARAALRTEQDQQKVDVALFMLVLIGPGATVMVQLLFLAFDAYSIQMSVAVEGVWAMLFPIAAALSVARFQSFGLANDSRPGLRIILFAMLFPMAFALGWMAGQNSFPDAPTWLVALIFMLALTPFSKMLWKQAYSWAGAILGTKDDDEDDEASEDNKDDEGGGGAGGLGYGPEASIYA